MKADFHKFKSLDEFDQEKINRFARLDAIPGFCLLRSEKEYLECYRAILKKTPGMDDGGPQGSIYLKDEPAVAEEEAPAEEPVEEPEVVEEEPKPKKSRKTTTTETTEE